jgi:ribosome biogenesis GTPase / thiamine phosphate phosphatase
LSEFDLGALGWTPELAEQLEPGLVPGRVVAAHRAAYDVETDAGAVRTRLPGRLLHENVDVAVGDWVGLGDGLIRMVLPRRSAIVRQAAGRTS